MTVINRNSGSPVYDTASQVLLADLSVGQVPISLGSVAPLDGGSAIYIVQPPGSGGLVMANGNELIALSLAISDGKISSFFQASTPTAEAIGDLWFDTDDGNKIYRWSGASWFSAVDTDIAIALSDAATAQATADSKVVTFYQDAAPTAEGTGDLWVDTDDRNKLYRWSGASWVLVADEDIATALSDAATAQATADGKITTFFQSSAPSAEGIGDLWFDTNDGNTQYRWSGASWVSSADSGIATAIAAASTAQATADGKVVTFYQTSAPTAEGTGDLWIDTDDGNKLYRWNGSSWASAVDADINNALADAATAQSTADGKIVSFYQASAPTAEGIGDIWFDTDDNDTPYRWSGASWVATPQDTADWSKVFGGGKPSDNADVTQTAIEAGTTIGTGFLHLNGTTANIAIGTSSTFGTKGIQLDYNSGAPRAYIGDPANSYLEYSASGFVLAVDRIGAGSTSGVNSIAFGENSTASGVDSVSIGSGSSAQSASSTSIGYLSEISATASSAIAIGRSASIGTSCNSSISIGTNSEILDNSSDSVALGTGTSVDGFSAIAVGYESEVIDDSGVSIGAYTSSGKNSVAIGDSASSPSQGSISIGVASYAAWGGSTGNVALGPNAVASFQNTVAIGDTAIANVVNRFTLGNSNNKIYVPGSEISIQGNEVWHNGNDDFDNAVTGHIRYPNGFKIAWGDGTSTSDGSQSFSYGTTFTGVRRVIVSSAGSTSPGTTSFSHDRVDDLGGSFTFSWIAIGWS